MCYFKEIKNLPDIDWSRLHRPKGVLNNKVNDSINTSDDVIEKEQ